MQRFLEWFRSRWPMLGTGLHARERPGSTQVFAHERVQRAAISTSSASLLIAVYLVALTNRSFWHQLRLALAPEGVGDYLKIAAVGLALVALWWALVSTLSWRRIAKPAWVAIIAIAAGSAYFMDSYGLIVDRVAIQSVFESDPSELSEWLGWQMLPYALMALLPALIIYRQPIRYATWSGELLRKLIAWAIALTVVVAVIWPNYQQLSSVARNNRQLGHLLNPLAAIGGIQAYAKQALDPKGTFKTIVGGDATLIEHEAPARPTLLVVVIGESARASSFELLGYGRPTNPRLKQLDLLAFSDVRSCGTSTAVSLPCMFSDLDQANYSDRKVRGRESLLDVLAHAGLDSVWIDNNTGSKHIADRVTEVSVANAKDPQWCNENGCYDDILTDRLAQLIDRGGSPAVVVLHQKGSHGPSYFQRYPPQFERFQPACHSNQLEDCSREQILNTYDNTIAYTDHNLAEVIKVLAARTDIVDSAMLYLSDHGESTGENGLYLHGAPNFMAPSEQTRIPMLLWMSEPFATQHSINQQCLRDSAQRPVSHDYLFHSVLGVMGVATSDYSADLDLFAGCRSPEPGVLAAAD